MAEGRQRAGWQHTSALLATLVNTNRARGQPAKPSDFDPFAEKPKRKAPVSVLRDVFDV